MVKAVSNIKIANSYATSWFEASKDAKILDTVLSEAVLLKDVMAKESEVWKALSVPLDDNNQKVKFVEEISKKAKFSQITSEILKLIAKNNRFALMGIVIDELFHLNYADKGIIEVRVQSAVELPLKEDKRLKKVLENKLGSKVVLQYDVNPSVMGGLNICFDSKQIDDTILAKLRRIEKMFKTQL